MTEKMIIDAYVRMRTIDNTIPDEVLDFMKNAAIEKLMTTHHFNAPDNEKNSVWCRCGRYLTDPVHNRQY